MIHFARHSSSMHMVGCFVAAAACVLTFGATGALASPGEIAAAQAASAVALIAQHVGERLEHDFETMQEHRPSYPFWRHIFMVPDGRIAFGSATDGRLLATFPIRGDWRSEAVWADRSLATVLEGRPLPASLDDRRERTAELFETATGPVVHNPTRGLFLLPNIGRYGRFLSEWGAIYERFGVPAEIGLAQAVVESGLSGTVRSEARAVGFCQWLLRNWRRLDALSPHVLEGHNQTTQAPYCAAYLSILATIYGSFIPALSEHHTGGANVGRTLINGARLGGITVRERYFLGAEFARNVRLLEPRTFQDVYGTYGPRSYLYTEMVFGNTATVREILESTPQQKIFAMRTPRAISLDEVARVTRLDRGEIQRFNPALRSRVPAGATLYLPRYVPAFGRDVAFWHRPPDPAYAAVLLDFVRLDERALWIQGDLTSVLARFRQRFRDTETEEGTIMATTLAYVIEDRRTSRQDAIVEAFRTSERILALFERARTLLNAALAARTQQ
jgi:hypothetical protein